MAWNRPRETTLPRCALIALSLVTALSACVTGREMDSKSVPAQEDDRTSNDRRTAFATGEVVSETSKSILYVFQARNDDYWFGSDDGGVYRHDGRILVHFTTKDGLVSNKIRGIQEDKSGNVYFTTYAGISKFDGRAFTTLTVSVGSDSEWRDEPDNLWFVGAPDDGVVYRYDGTSLHRLKFPSTKLGDDHLAKYPRDRYPNVKYSPYDVYSILRDKKGNVWFGTSNVGVGRFDGKEFRWLTDHALVVAPVRSVLEDSQGNFWFSYSGGSSIGEPRAVDGMRDVEERARGTVIDAMSIAEDDDGNIWTADLGPGASKYEAGRKVHYPMKDGDTTISVFSIYKDHHGVLWLGSHNGGAFRFDGKTFEPFRP